MTQRKNHLRLVSSTIQHRSPAVSRSGQLPVEGRFFPCFVCLLHLLCFLALQTTIHPSLPFCHGRRCSNEPSGRSSPDRSPVNRTASAVFAGRGEGTGREPQRKHEQRAGN